jgi:hypothetical protein
MGAIGAFFSGIAFKILLWMLDKALSGIINSGASDPNLEKVADVIDGRIDKFQELEQDAGKAARERLERFADLLKAKLQAP